MNGVIFLGARCVQRTILEIRIKNSFIPKELKK